MSTHNITHVKLEIWIFSSFELLLVVSSNIDQTTILFTTKLRYTFGNDWFKSAVGLPHPPTINFWKEISLGSSEVRTFQIWIWLIHLLIISPFRIIIGHKITYTIGTTVNINVRPRVSSCIPEYNTWNLTSLYHWYSPYFLAIRYKLFKEIWLRLIHYETTCVSKWNSAQMIKQMR